jgi:hypothetical protein
MAGAAGYVLKQIRCSDLIDSVRRVAAGRSLLERVRRGALQSGVTCTGYQGLRAAWSWSGPPRPETVRPIAPDAHIGSHTPRVRPPAVGTAFQECRTDPASVGSR